MKNRNTAVEVFFYCLIEVNNITHIYLHRKSEDVIGKKQL